MKKPSILRNKTLIVGCGRLGASIASRESSSGKNVVVVDKDANSFESLSDRFSGYKVIGDITDTTVLENAYIETAKEIIITTGDDNVNIFIAHLAFSIYDVPNIYVRLDDPTLEALVKDMNIHVIFPFELSLDKFDLMRGRGGKKR